MVEQFVMGPASHAEGGQDVTAGLISRFTFTEPSLGESSVSAVPHLSLQVTVPSKAQGLQCN